jgi:hypothetical protein
VDCARLQSRIDAATFELKGAGPGDRRRIRSAAHAGDQVEGEKWCG